MSTIGIIAEFNPFHNGHKYLIDEARKITGADNVVIICSGNYVQRGTPAIINKSDRTFMALSNGADAVFELPVFYSTASAETFARSSVRFLDKLNCIDYLCFGCEYDDLNLLSQISNILLNEPSEYKRLLSEALKNGISFPKARMNALISYYSTNENIDKNQISDILSLPNNILAIEYLKALKLFHSKIQPIPIKRQGAGYHSSDLDCKYASATGIREQLQDTKINSIKKSVPKNCYPIISKNNTITINDYDTLLGYKLISHNDFSHIYGINPELSNRINNHKYDYTNIADFTTLLQSKNYTYSAISRALIHIALDITEEDVTNFISNDYFSYARLLGFNKKSDILSIIKEKSSLSIISKYSTFYNQSHGLTKKMLDISINSDHIYRMLYMNKYHEYMPTEFENKIFIKN